MIAKDALPPASKRFTIKPAGGGLIALHCTCHNRFLSINSRGVTGQVGAIDPSRQPIPDQRHAERLLLVAHPY